MDTPVLFLYTDANINWSGSGTNAMPLTVGGSRGSSVGTYKTTVSVAGTISLLRVSTITDPTPGSMTFTLLVNGVASTLICAITAGNTTASDITHTVSVAAGDVVEIKGQGASTPTLPTNYNGSVVFTSTASGKSLIFGSSPGGLSNSATRYYVPQGTVTGQALVTTNPTAMPTAGVFSNLYVNLSNTPGVGTSYTFTLYKNGVATALTCIISDSATAGSDLTHSVTYAANDLISLEVVPVGTPTSRTAGWGILFAPTIDGESLQMSSIASLAGNATTRFLSAGGAGVGNTGTESLARIAAPTFTAKKLYVNLSVAPGVIDSNTTILRKTGADTALTTVVSGAVQTANNDSVHTVSYTGGDTVDFTMSTSTTAATTRYSPSFVSYIAPPAVPGGGMLLRGVG